MAAPFPSVYSWTFNPSEAELHLLQFDQASHAAIELAYLKSLENNKLYYFVCAKYKTFSEII